MNGMRRAKQYQSLRKHRDTPLIFFIFCGFIKQNISTEEEGGKRRAARSGRHHQCRWLEMMIWQKVKITPPSGIGASQDEPMNWHNSSTMDGWYYNYVPRGTTYLVGVYMK